MGQETETTYLRPASHSASDGVDFDSTNTYNGGGTTYTTVDADGKLRFVLTCSEDGSKWLAADGAPVAGPVGCFG
ncbi:hypothetical protein PRIPAC_82049 [Pristionchus pacificus]|uniref:Uncharacterized protein n=1 Tax=Pristionchus pacificus TaxID=54126 RepID=A0A454Y089_PRIPA|nr:hypothetical protein PRIPAC_82049 [Pristionchus pacificus]|eukprot:PDM79953.1 hypothetical protein PRIPAC_32532 [Pristionchus pacificus]